MKSVLVLLVCLISILSFSHAANIQTVSNDDFVIYLDEDTGLFTANAINSAGQELPILFGGDDVDPIPLTSYITIYSDVSGVLYITGVYSNDPRYNSIDPDSDIAPTYLGAPDSITTEQNGLGDDIAFVLTYSVSGDFDAEIKLKLVTPTAGSGDISQQIQSSVAIETTITNKGSIEGMFQVNYALDYSVDTDNGPTFRAMTEASARQRYARAIEDPKFDYFVLESNLPVVQPYSVVGSVNVPEIYTLEQEASDYSTSRNETSSTIHDVYGFMYTTTPKVLYYTAIEAAYNLIWADAQYKDSVFTVSVAQGLELNHRGLYDPTALKDDSVVVYTWELMLKPNIADFVTTSFFVIFHNNYLGNQAQMSCSDNFACTYDYFADVDCYDSECINLPIHSFCNDENPCTIDFCDQSSKLHDADGCTHIEKNCDDEVPCTYDYCDQATGECVHDPTQSAITCDDQNSCTVDICDTANGGAEGLGKCLNIANDSFCGDPADKCNTHYCDAQPGSGCLTRAVNCNDDILCTDDSCDPATGCSNIPRNSSCDDSIPCTVDICDVEVGKCMNYPTNTLCDDQDPCTVDYCDIIDGCIHVPMECHKTELSCTLDYCIQGSCIHIADDVQCNDHVACTVDHCNLRLSECTNNPNNASCNDNQFCTDDYCDVSKGCKHQPHSCDDNIPCNEDYCDPTDGGRCVNDYSNQAVICDDGIACTIDVCDKDLAKCTHKSDNHTCDDSDPCTTDYCDAFRGCIHVRKYCNDENPCTVDTCVDGSCVFTNHTAASIAVCDDHVMCTDDVCDSNVGCINSPMDYKCNDNIACTDDVCTGANCTNTPNDFNCDDGIPCTIDQCDKVRGCIHTLVDEVCDDHINSTKDTCTELGCHFELDNSACVGFSTECAESVATYEGCKTTYYDSKCDDNITCTHDRCGGDGVCIHDAHHDECSDDVGCTDDVCSTNATVGLGCVHTANARHCSDMRDCTTEICDESYGCIIEYTALCTEDTGSERCINCHSPRSRIGITNYDDGTADFRIQTRLKEVVPFTTVSPLEGLTENMVIKNFGPIVFGQEEYVSNGPSVVIGANSGLRLVPTADGLPRCNEVSRGMIVVKESKSTDATKTITDGMYICLHEVDSYTWVKYI